VNERQKGTEVVSKVGGGKVETGEREEEEGKKVCETGKKEDGKMTDGAWCGLIKKLSLSGSLLPEQGAGKGG